MTEMPRSRLVWPRRPVLLAMAAMVAVIVLSNLLVQHEINAWLTWGAFSYPLVFLVSDLSNRGLGPQAARRVAWAGFAVAVAVSLALAPWRIAMASGAAFILSQLFDVAVFNRWRQRSWWKAPLMGSLAASAVDTAVFFFLAFAGSQMDWLQLAAGEASSSASPLISSVWAMRFMGDISANALAAAGSRSRRPPPIRV